MQPLSTRKREETVARRIAAAVGPGFPADAPGEALDDLQAAIGRPVIYDDDLFGRPCLRKRAFDRLLDPTLRVVNRDENGDERTHAIASRATAQSARTQRLPRIDQRTAPDIEGVQSIR